MSNYCFTDNYKQYLIHNDNDKIKPPDRYLFLNLMSLACIGLLSFPNSRILNCANLILCRFLSCPRRQFLLRWRVPRINNNNARYKMMHQFVFILLKSMKIKLVRHNTKHNTISLTSTKSPINLRE